VASTLDFVQYICDQINAAGHISYRKMFGEYGIYCDGKMFALVCDDRFLVKITEPGRAFIPDCPTDLPYPGAKACFLITELEDRPFLEELTRITCAALPEPAPKKKKT
jgi:TfoX/Sxy family transcriptional regulator of competence genes